mgnify:CR=1 FL=1
MAGNPEFPLDGTDEEVSLWEQYFPLKLTYEEYREYDKKYE